MSTERPVILILGPTAGGKTALAIDLATVLPGGGECLCADSMQVYRGMDLGTAKPTAAEQRRVPHHLLDLVEPTDEFSVDVWLARAEETIAAVRGRGRFPIVVGGTNLYVQALLVGLDDVPEPDRALRSSLLTLDAERLRSRLEDVDPAAAARIHPNDRKRTVRAIEVYERTGRRLSDLQQSWGPARPRPDACLIGLDWPVEKITRRINRRVRAMMEAGLLEEVRGLWQAGRLGRQAREALGYRQIVDHLEGRGSLEEAIEQIKIRTRRFAKQQRTWLRRFRANPRSAWLPADELDQQSLVRESLTLITDRPPPPVRDGPGAPGTTPPSPIGP